MAKQVRIVWTVADHREKHDVVSCLDEQAAIDFARTVNVGANWGRFQVERSMVIGGRTV